LNRKIRLAAVLALIAAPAFAQDMQRPKPFVIASTTSVRDSGLMDALLPVFQEESGLRVQLVAVGSGAALKMGADGNADALFTHEPDGEKALVDAGALVDHHPVMENFFLIAGPAADPAKIADAKDAAAAMAKIAAAQAPYASRGDDSGTHRREQSLMKKAGLDPAATWPGLLRTGQGMGATLEVAGEKQAYALTDLATFRAFAKSIGLAPVFDRRTPDLRNLYSVSRPNPEKLKPGQVDVESAKRFIAFMTSPATAERIRAFDADGGVPLFTPLATPQ
jgi:tungstate transport system substrate-binding protein